ncbi:MAG: cardiolipin synthase, partial [Bacteroidales bacterium]|nr:cardiolipin synthase [Bacteroidales bacterium]
KVRFYRKGFLHAKTIVADDAFVSIGSTNVDVRSYTLDFEIDAYMFSPEMAMRQKEAFLKDCADAELVDPVRWASRPWLQKMKESLARLLSPLL